MVGSTFKSFVEVTTIFSENLYPESLTTKEIEFMVDNTICQMFLAKFAQRFSILSDD